MGDRIRKLMVPALFGVVVASVWTLGAVKADLESPLQNEMRVDPDILQRAIMAAERERSRQAMVDSGGPVSTIGRVAG